MAKKHVESTHLIPRLVCEQIGVSIETVLGWIHSGSLKASNISSSSKRPRWRIAKTDLADFLESRSNQTTSVPSSSRRRKTSKPRREYVV